MQVEVYLRFVLALVFVLALIGLLAWVARRYGFGGHASGRSSRTRRLEIVETKTVDGKRRLVLLRRDDVEHLVLTGPNSEILIEQGITGFVTTGAGAGSAPLAGPAAGPAAAPETVSDPAGKPRHEKSDRVSGKSSVFKDEVAKSLSKTKSRRAAKA